MVSGILGRGDERQDQGSSSVDSGESRSISIGFSDWQGVGIRERQELMILSARCLGHRVGSRHRAWSRHLRHGVVLRCPASRREPGREHIFK